MNTLIKTVALSAVLLTFSSCQRVKEEILLKPKVYFEKSQENISIDDQKIMEYDLRARISTASDEAANLLVSIGDEEMVKEYNARNGTEFDYFGGKNAALNTNAIHINAGEIYSDAIKIQLNGLSEVAEGKKYLMPVCISSSNLPVIKGSDIVYFNITKPVKIKKAWKLGNDCIKIPLVVDKKYTSVTYEALVNMDHLNSNNTVMGTEGILILRIGDPALPGGANNLIQVAGNKQYHSDKVKFEKNRWYHVAFTYDVNTGNTAIYVNGEKVAEAKWDTPGFTLGQSPYMSIGRIEAFMWGTRPLSGYMSEARFWTVARTQQQIQENMLTVDPKSEGLEVYYKLNGTDQYKAEDGKMRIRNATGNSALDGIPNGGAGVRFADLEVPVAIK